MRLDLRPWAAARVGLPGSRSGLTTATDAPESPDRARAAEYELDPPGRLTAALDTPAGTVTHQQPFDTSHLGQGEARAGHTAKEFVNAGGTAGEFRFGVGTKGAWVDDRYH